MDKECLFLGKTASGVFAQSLFGSAGAFEKVAGAPAFSDWETGEQLRRYIKRITADDRRRNVYVLVNALGAGESYGSNINADWFGWDALSHDGDDYGYQTFNNAHIYQHHANKDPSHAIGKPVLSALNHRMKRVELIIKLDRERARAEGADPILVRIDSGEYPDVSMGCRVPFDVCSICDHRSKTREDYCHHMRPPPEMRGVFGPNKILPDGRQICVKNLTPRFFDLSFVFMGADKCAKVMAKLAARGTQLCIGPVCAIPSDPESQALLFDSVGEPLSITKAASVEEGMRGPCGKLCADCSDCDSCHTAKLASGFGVKVAEQKKAEIIKNIPVNSFSMKKLPGLEKAEPDIQKDDLDQLAQHPLPRVLGAATHAGIVLKPHEFQRLVLVRMGKTDLADQLDEGSHVFRETREHGDQVHIDQGDPLEEAFSVIRRYIKDRTSFGSPFALRVVFVDEGRKKALPTRKPIEHALLDKVSAAYNSYRHSILMKLSQAVDAVQSDPRSRETFFGDALSNMFTKTANAPLVSLDTVAYVMGAHFQDRTLLCKSAVADAAQLRDEWLYGAERA